MNKYSEEEINNEIKAQEEKELELIEQGNWEELTKQQLIHREGALYLMNLYDKGYFKKLTAKENWLYSFLLDKYLENGSRPFLITYKEAGKAIKSPSCYIGILLKKLKKIKLIKYKQASRGTWIDIIDIVNKGEKP